MTDQREVYRSYVKWPEGTYPFGDDVTTDSHHTEDEAIAVVRRLESEGWGGEGRIFPINVLWLKKWDGD